MRGNGDCEFSSGEAVGFLAGMFVIACGVYQIIQMIMWVCEHVRITWQ